MYTFLYFIHILAPNNQSINQLSKHVCLSLCLEKKHRTFNRSRDHNTLQAYVHTQTSDNWVQLSQTCFWLWSLHTGVLHFQQQLVALWSLVLEHNRHPFLFCWSAPVYFYSVAGLQQFFLSCHTFPLLYWWQLAVTFHVRCHRLFWELCEEVLSRKCSAGGILLKKFLLAMLQPVCLNPLHNSQQCFSPDSSGCLFMVVSLGTRFH